MQIKHPNFYLITASIMLAVIFQLNQEFFLYLSQELWHEPWRLFTSHFVHVGWVHLLLNMSAFLCLFFIFPQTSWRLVLIGMVCLPLFISVGIYIWCDHIQAYAGFSGVLHGLYTLIAIDHLKNPRERKFAIGLLCGIVAKLLWEIYSKESSMTADLIGSPVLIEAHQLGVVGALGLIILIKIFKKLTK